MSTLTAHRFLVPALTSGALAAGLVGVTGPAAAAPATNCSAVETSMEYVSGYVVGEKYRICSDGTIRANSVSVQRQNPSTGMWTTVASGSGIASYQCQGTSSRRFRLGTTGVGTLYPCT